MTSRRAIITSFVGGSIFIAGCSGTNPESTDDSFSNQSEDNSTLDSNTGNSETDSTDNSGDTQESGSASFELVGYDVPDTVEIGEEVTIKISVKNTGGETGDYSAPLHVKTAELDWQELADWEFTGLEPDETVTAESYEPFIFDYIGRYELRLGEFSETAVIQSVSAKVSWGSEYITPEGYRIRVDRPVIQETYSYEGFQGEIKQKETESGRNWAFINIWVKNETGNAEYSPTGSEFALLYDNSQADGETYLGDEPINKEEPFDGGELQPGVERSGWVAYQIPKDLSVNDLTVAWAEDTFVGQIAANWRDAHA